MGKKRTDSLNHIHLGGKSKKERLLQLSEISLWLDSYEDIFSDFDSRPYNQRALSGDFLTEAKKASLDKDSKIELKLLVPKKKINKKYEDMIVRRLKEHFNKHFRIIENEVKGMKEQGFLFIAFGIVLMFLATLLLFKYGETGFFTSFLIILLEPGGWFLFWEGLDTLLFESKRAKPDLDFYKKMTKCRISFIGY